MPMLTPEDRAAIGSGLQHSMEQMSNIVKIVTWDPRGGTPGGGTRANIYHPPGTNPIYIRLFEEMQKILHEIETELLRGWHPPPPPAP